MAIQKEFNLEKIYTVEIYILSLSLRAEVITSYQLYAIVEKVNVINTSVTKPNMHSETMT